MENEKTKNEITTEVVNPEETAKKDEINMTELYDSASTGEIVAFAGLALLAMDGAYHVAYYVAKCAIKAWDWGKAKVEEIVKKNEKPEASQDDSSK